MKCKEGDDTHISESHSHFFPNKARSISKNMDQSKGIKEDEGEKYFSSISQVMQIFDSALCFKIVHNDFPSFMEGLRSINLNKERLEVKIPKTLKINPSIRGLIL